MSCYILFVLLVRCHLQNRDSRYQNKYIGASSYIEDASNAFTSQSYLIERPPGVATHSQLTFSNDTRDVSKFTNFDPLDNLLIMTILS